MSKEKQIEKDKLMRLAITAEKEWNELRNLFLDEKIDDIPNKTDYLVDKIIEAGYRKQSENTVELPCKIGDLLYMPWEWNGQKGIAYLTVTVLRCIIGFGWSFGTDFDTDDEDYYEAYNCGSFMLKDFGEIVFLTREEAEAKMKGGEE